MFASKGIELWLEKMPVGGRLAGKAGYSDGGYQGQGNLLDSLVPSLRDKSDT